MKKGIRFLGVFLLLLLAYVVVVLLHGTFTDYQPEEKIRLDITGQGQTAVLSDSVLSAIIWNVGYAGLGKESDFFYDNDGFLLSKGHMVRPGKELTVKNIAGMKQVIGQTKADFWLFQEMDERSKRSYFMDMVDTTALVLNGISHTFAPNYKTPRVPLPLLEPWNAYGEVLSGLATYSRFTPASAHRYQLPGDFGWPMRIFNLDRCLAVHRYKHAKGPDLVMINIHNSAFDKGGVLKQQELGYLRKLVLAEYKKGNYVVAGGDWNMCPPNFPSDAFSPGQGQRLNLDADFFPEDWLWVYDPRVATNRQLDSPYEAGKTFTTLIDFFLVSPNVKVRTIKGIDLQFQHSDHQPVWLEFELL